MAWDRKGNKRGNVKGSMVGDEAKEVVGQTDNIGHGGHSLYPKSNRNHCNLLSKGVIIKICVLKGLLQMQVRGILWRRTRAVK